MSEILLCVNCDHYSKFGVICEHPKSLLYIEKDLVKGHDLKIFTSCKEMRQMIDCSTHKTDFCGVEGKYFKSKVESKTSWWSSLFKTKSATDGKLSITDDSTGSVSLIRK